jgi:hypothetical protein
MLITKPEQLLRKKKILTRWPKPTGLLPTSRGTKTAMPLPSCEQFDMGRCPGCPLKNAVARFIVHNQVAEKKGESKLDPTKDRFLPAHDAKQGLTTRDNEKFNAIMIDEDDNPYYTVDDRDCEGPTEVVDFGIFKKIECGAFIVSQH